METVFPVVDAFAQEDVLFFIIICQLHFSAPLSHSVRKSVDPLVTVRHSFLFLRQSAQLNFIIHFDEHIKDIFFWSYLQKEQGM